MKRILISMNCSESNYGEKLDIIADRWAFFLEKCELHPVFLPNNYNTKLFLENEKIDGVLLTGGINLGISKKRDKAEKIAFEYALIHKLPILGVCRGMQFIANYYGVPLKKVENHANVRHNLIINKKSKYLKLIEKNKDVNSFHNNAITSIPVEFTLTAQHQNGTIKAMENEGIFCQMWHPERENPFKKHDIEFFRYFFGVKERE
jgi:putative glutamine amidotransferase